MMSPIHINRDRQTIGQFTPEEVSTGLASGRFLPSDLGWCPGMETWKCLSEFQDLPPAPVAEEPLPPVPQQPPQPTVMIEPPWERRFSLGYSQALWQTIGKLLTKPREVFSRMRSRGDFVSPLLYVILLTVVVGILTLPYGPLYSNVMKQLVQRLPNAGDYPAALFQSPPLNLASIGMAIVLMPVLATVGSFLRAALLHLVLYLVGGANKGFESTYRITSYSDATTAIFRIIPFVGILIAIVLDFWLLIVGLKEVNRIESWRAVLTVFFLPICFLAFILAGAAFAGFF